MRKSYKTIQSNPTTKVGTKRDVIVKLKLQNPSMSLKEVKDNAGCSYAYAREVWSSYMRRQLTIRGSPLSPLSVHGWFFWNAVPPVWLLNCPLEVSVNRNGQRVFRGRCVSAVFHVSGQVFVYPYFMGWDLELRDFLLSWWNGERVDLFMGSLVEQGKKEVAFHTPNVPANFKVRVKGLGTFKTDTTPYPDGTTEYEIDPDFLKRLARLEKSQKEVFDVLSVVSRNLGVFGEGMKDHMKLIGSLQEVVDGMKKVDVSAVLDAIRVQSEQLVRQGSMIEALVKEIVKIKEKTEKV